MCGHFYTLYNKEGNRLKLFQVLKKLFKQLYTRDAVKQYKKYPAPGG